MPTAVRLLNFVVVGQVRSGTGLVQTSVDNRPEAVCHADLFHAKEEVRRQAHEAYFGAGRNPEKFPEWFVDEVTNPVQYVNHVVLDNPRRGECAVGFRALYPIVRRYELEELFETRGREGDFCLVHVLRNPVACLVSLKQAERTGVWTRSWNDPPQTSLPSPVSLDAEELTAFVREHAAIQGKIRAACSDCLEVPYRELFLDYQGVMRRIFEHLELHDSVEPAISGCRRLRNREIRERIANLAALRLDLPSDVAAYVDAEDLF